MTEQNKKDMLLIHDPEESHKYSQIVSFFFHILNDMSPPVSLFSSTGHFTSPSLCLLASPLNSCLSVRQR